MATAELEQEELVHRLFTRFVFFCENVLVVEDKLTQQPIPFKLKPVQRRIAARILWRMYQNKEVRFIILKARREGVSTLIQAFFFWLASTRPNFKAVTIGEDDTTTSYLHGMAETFYEKMPEVFQPQRRTSKKGSTLEFGNPAKNVMEQRRNPGLDSSLRTVSWKNAAAGQGARGLHLSEVALYPREQAKKTLDTALQTIPRAGGTFVFQESTARGVGNEFHRRWRLAESGISEYEAIFIPWSEEPTNRATPPPDFRRTPEEEYLAAEFSLDDEQLFWRRLTIENECGGDIDTFHQEYPLTPEEAFLSTGRPYFDMNELKRHALECERTPPWKRGRLVERVVEGHPWAVFEDNSRGELRIWTPPNAEEDYVIFCDSSEGAERQDFQCAYVMPRSRHEIDACWHGRFDRDMLGDILFSLGHLYGGLEGEALVAIELTGGWGLTPQAIMRRRGYKRIYQRVTVDRRTNRRRVELGWKTTPETRALMLDQLKQSLRSPTFVVNDAELVEECFTFVYDEKGKPQGESGAFDDRVIAAAGCDWLWHTEPRAHKPVPLKPRKVRSLRAGY